MKKIIHQIAVCLILATFLMFPVQSCAMSKAGKDLKAVENSAQGEEQAEAVVGEAKPGTQEAGVKDIPQEKIDSEELVKSMWAASGQNNLDELNRLVGLCMEWYGAKALEQNSSLSNFPNRGTEKEYQALNDVGTCQFIKGESLMNNGRKEEAIAHFESTIKDYKWAQAWDPSRGSFWSIAEKSQASIDVLTGKVFEREQYVSKPRELILPTLHFPGKQSVIDYTKYGEFEKVGTKDYHFKITDPKGLSDAVGEGIYPNTGGVLKNPGYKKARKEGRLEGSHWDFVYSSDIEAAYYKWATGSSSSLLLFRLASTHDSYGPSISPFLLWSESIHDLRVPLSGL